MEKTRYEKRWYTRLTNEREQVSHTTKQAVDAPVEKCVLTIINEETFYEKT
jgi:hypothetical protein